VQKLVVTVLVIGLTGGIASGKSTAAQQLSELGATVLDADVLGHEVYKPGRPAWRKIVAAFGKGIRGPADEIDRKRLGALVFGDPQAMQRLTGIVWPVMKREMAQRLRRLAEAGTPIVVLEAAVLLEAGWEDLVDEVWALSVSPEVAASRLVERTGISLTEAHKRLAAQMSNDERGRKANVIIENNGTLADLRERVASCWQQLLLRA
jgi:dephospho-CoA kinase